MFTFFKNVGHSILFKLLLVFIVTAVVLVVAVGSILRHYADNSPHRQLIGKNLAQYSTYLTGEIGIPPNLELARKLASELGLVINILTPSVEWSSTPSPLRDEAVQYHRVPGFSNVQRGRYHGRLFVRVNDPAAQFVLIFGKRGEVEGHSHGEVLLLLLLVIGTILALSYLVVRWLLQPLGWLTGGMKRMGGGHLDTTIPVRKFDELGDLTQAFNDMSAKIRNAVRAKQQLLLDVSHELRSPMTRMKLAAEFIQDKKVKDQIVADLVEMEVMTDEILESERLASEQGGLSRKRINLTSLLREIIANYHDHPPGVTLLTDDAVCVLVDPERARALFRNVIDNALKYSEEQAHPVQVAISLNTDSVSVTVKDFGRGIPAQDQALLFEPFYRVDKSRQKRTGGYGLGLSMCKKIMEAHNGSITVSSELGISTTFSMTFPRF